MGEAFSDLYGGLFPDFLWFLNGKHSLVQSLGSGTRCVQFAVKGALRGRGIPSKEL